MINVGIITIQGGFLEHETAFKKCMLSEEFCDKKCNIEYSTYPFK